MRFWSYNKYVHIYCLSFNIQWMRSPSLSFSFTYSVFELWSQFINLYLSRFPVSLLIFDSFIVHFSTSLLIHFFFSHVFFLYFILTPSRDIKGANVLVTDAGVAKLADFGCSKQLPGKWRGSPPKEKKRGNEYIVCNILLYMRPLQIHILPFLSVLFFSILFFSFLLFSFFPLLFMTLLILKDLRLLSVALSYHHIFPHLPSP